jgi:hypothetical protein
VKARAVTWRDPLARGLFCVGIVAGSIGAVYPTGLLGEHHAPGLLAAAVLGICGAWFGGVAWGVVLGALLAASRGSGGQRAMAHTYGHHQLRVRAAELRSGGALVGVVALGGLAGGVVSALAQSASVGAPSSLFALGPGPGAVAAAAAVGFGSLLVGYVAGTSTARAATTLLLYGTLLAASLLLVGASYFVPSLTPVASATPGGLLVVLGRSELAAPQFTSTLSATTAALASTVWAMLLVTFSVRRLVRGVDA